MKIGIDIDSTLNTLEQSWSSWIVRNLDPAFTLDKWLDWNINKLTPAGEKVYEFLSIPGMFRGLGVREGAIAVSRQLDREGHELFVVSSCDPASSWADKFDWVEEHFPFIKKKNRIASSRKGLLKLDMLVDDGPHNFEDFTGAAVVFDQPWNRQYGGHRAYNWIDVYNLVKALR